MLQYVVFKLNVTKLYIIVLIVQNVTALTDKKPKKGWVYISPLEFIWENIHRFNVQEKPDHLDISRFVHGFFVVVFFKS